MKIPDRIALNFADFPEPPTVYIREDTLPNLTRAVLAIDLAKLERVLSMAEEWSMPIEMHEEAQELMIQIAQIRYEQSQETGQ